MITGELKNKTDRLWEMFWTGGITNPLDVIEQITYFMFIRDLDEIDNSQKNLSINKYKKSAYIEETYPHPREILAEINVLEAEIQSGLRELEGLLDG